MTRQHILLKTEATSMTWLAPSRAYPVKSFTPVVNQEHTDLRNTGQGYGLGDSWLGAYAPSASLEMTLYEEWLGTILQCAGFNTITPTVEGGGTLAYGHGAIPQESASDKSASLQAIYNSTNAVSMKGVVFDKVTLSCKAKEPANLKADLLAQDISRNGGTWGDGVAAPSVVASPTYFGATVSPLHFAGATLTLGGTPTLNTTTNVFSVAGATAVTTAEMAELSWSNGYLYDHVLGSVRNPTIRTRQARTVEGKLDLNWSTISFTHWDAMKAGTEQVLQLTFLGSLIEAANYYKMIVTLPKMVIRVADVPDIVGDQSKRVQTANFTAQVHPTMVDSGGQAYDIGIKLIDQETTYN